MTLHMPQIIYLFLVVLTLGVELTRHGEPRTGNHSFFIALLSAFIAVGLLYWGGFFK